MCVQLNLGVKKTPPNLQKPDPPNRCLSGLRIELAIEVVVVGCQSLSLITFSLSRPKLLNKNLFEWPFSTAIYNDRLKWRDYRVTLNPSEWHMQPRHDLGTGRKPWSWVLRAWGHECVCKLELNVTCTDILRTTCKGIMQNHMIQKALRSYGRHKMTKIRI